MITPSYSPTATERVLPRMALDFTTGVLDSRVTIARALNTATRTNSSGVIEIVNADLPRFDYNPSTLALRGLLIEGARTNLFLNSLINGTSLSTQTVAVTATPYTISFYGTGTITLSGATTATVTGTGVYPSRKTLTFTPTAGALICTVTGSVQYAQIEVGDFATSFIPTAATSVTRNADVVSMTGTNFSDWYNASEGTFAVWFDTVAASAGAAIWALVATDNTLTERVAIGATPTIPRGYVYAAGSAQADMYNGTVVNNTQKKCAISYKQNSFAFSTNGASPATDVSGVTPTLTQMFIGKYSTTYLSGHVAKVLYWPQRVTNAENQAFSK